MMLSIPDPHTLLVNKHGTVSGMPTESERRGGTGRKSSLLGWVLTQGAGNHVSEDHLINLLIRCVGSTSFREYFMESKVPERAVAARSVVFTSESTPRLRPIGVRFAATITTFLINFLIT